MNLVGLYEECKRSSVIILIRPYRARYSQYFCQTKMFEKKFTNNWIGFCFVLFYKCNCMEPQTKICGMHLKTKSAKIKPLQHFRIWRVTSIGVMSKFIKLLATAQTHLLCSSSSSELDLYATRHKWQTWIRITMNEVYIISSLI